jgi:hypothetical protein
VAFHGPTGVRHSAVSKLTSAEMGMLRHVSETKLEFAGAE